ncbi:MAG TPA: amidohydrolase family protein [Solirubrobacteraceae bacterium]|jgi:cytosine/adenosine deaminase-related metal-dependent hydrolase|nr:amidohydrolase family protein [Solirubrobacteraceae bacterium]
MSERILLTGGYVLSMDREIGELDRGDVLIEDGVIAAVAESIEGADAETIDVTGHVVMPGFVDTHRHTWQTPFRGVCADWTLEDYFRGIRMSISPNCAAEDVYAGNYVGALEALEAGVTTILDFSHCNNTPEHADAALAGLLDSGIRAMFAYGYYPAPSAEPGFPEHDQRLADARRIREHSLSSDSALVTMGVALTEVGLLPFEQTIAEARSAVELGIPSVLHTGCNWGSPVTEGVHELDHHGLLGPHQIHVHCNTLDDRDLRRLAANDCKISTSPETEIQMGMGRPVIGRALAHGLRPSLSCDVMSSNSGDMFSQMRIGLQFERCMQNDAFNARNTMPEKLELSVRDALGWATINGAHAMGLEHRVGSLTPGKQADVIVVGGRRLNMVPMADPVGCIVAQANPSNVRHVLVAGRFAKRDGELIGVDVDHAIALAESSCERVLARVRSTGQPLLAPTPDGFADLINTMAAQHLARAWAIEVSA